MTIHPTYTELQLLRYNGDNGPIYIAYQGNIFDVSDCPHWRTGMHEKLHFPGQDLTKEFPGAPHGEEVFRHPCIRLVGKLA